MFGDIPHSLFAVHNWRTDIVTLGELPASFIQEQSGGLLDYTWPAQVNRMIAEGASTWSFPSARSCPTK